jgi:hypothetical protein
VVPVERDTSPRLPLGDIGARCTHFFLRDSAVGLRSDDKVPVIGHDAIRQDADAVSVMGYDHGALERLEVGVLAQEVHPAHRSVRGIVHLPILCFSCGANEGNTRRSRRVAGVSIRASPLRSHLGILDAYARMTEREGATS